MKFTEARATLQALVDNAAESSNAIVSTDVLRGILTGFDNDEQVLTMHNTAVTLLLLLGGQVEVKPENVLQIHHTHGMEFLRLPEGKMLLKIIVKKGE